MKTLSGLIVFMLAGAVLGDPAKTSLSAFFAKTVKELSDIDALGIAPFEIVFEDSIGVTFHLRNLFVTGLENQKPHEFSYDDHTKKVTFGYEANVFIGTDVVIEYTKKDSKTFRGYFTSRPNVVATFKSDLLVKKNEQGVEYYELGPETFTYKLSSAPQLDWSEDAKKELANDDDWKNQSPATFVKFNEKTIGEIVTKAFKYEIDGIRAALKKAPASTFTKN